jgi:hypothetical protein
MKVPSDRRTPSGSKTLTIAVTIVVAVVLAWIAYRTLTHTAPMPNFHW